MSCLFPVKISIKSNLEKPWSRYRYTGNKNYDSYGLSVRCNHCVNCIDEKIRVWTYRLIAESRTYEKMAFITLTYDDEHFPKNGSCSVSDVQKFIKRIRRYYDYHRGENDIVYYGCTEYGGEFGRPHVHLLVLGMDYNDFMPKDKKVVSHNTINCISPFWKKGLLNYGTDVSLMDSRMIRYVTKYVDKLDSDNLKKFCRIMGIEEPTVIHSQGIGSSYLSNCIKRYGDLPMLGGLRVSLPPYWQKKLDYSPSHQDFEDGLINKEIQKEKRKKLMSTQVDTNENYARLLESMKRGVK